MTVIAIDTGTETAVTFDTAGTDARNAMLTAAGVIATTVIDVEGKLAQSAKDWGCNLFRLVYADGSTVRLDDAIGDSKVAAGWNVLTTTDVGKKAKARLEVYFSNARLVAERWSGIDDAGKAAVLAGTSSIHYLAGQFRKADADAKKAAKKAAATAEAEAAKLAEAAAGAPSGTAPTESNAIPAGMSDAIASLIDLIANASDDDLNANYDGIAAIVAAYDARINAATDATPVAVAA